ncbi:MAG: hypothetical protein KDA73_12650 [Rhodobacteraceae bacterium]|nr:hypothetical protein [Paracoccaceae bacterium]
MVSGIFLTLMIGPMVPVPVPKEVTDALTAVEVTTSTTGPSMFQLSFGLSTRSPLHTLFMLQGGSMVPVIRVIIIVTVRGIPNVLMDGVITEQDVSPGDKPGQSTLTVRGEDLTRVMDYIEFTGIPYPAMPAEARIALVIAKYAMFGMIPLVVPSIFTDIPIPVERIPAHEGTDLDYVKHLADEAGYVFYIDPGPAPGTNVAYWGPEIKVGVPQPALNMDMDAHRNVESLNFRFDSQSKKLPIVWVQNPQTRVSIPLPIPDIDPLNPPLAAVPGLPKEFRFLPGTAKLSPTQAISRGAAEASRSSDVVRGSGTLDVLRYGRVLKARALVGVRGAGPAFDGLHYVSSVTHRIKPGQYQQSFELARNGLISLLPEVPP